MVNLKIHRAHVTNSNLNYVGSIKVEGKILETIDILLNEKVFIANNNNGVLLQS